MTIYGNKFKSNNFIILQRQNNAWPPLPLEQYANYATIFIVVNNTSVSRARPLLAYFDSGGPAWCEKVQAALDDQPGSARAFPGGFERARWPNS